MRTEQLERIANQYRIGYYQPMKSYSIKEINLILDRLNIKVRKPRLNHQTLVISTKRTKVYLVRDNKGYYFREQGIILHNKTIKLETNLTKVTEESVKLTLGLNEKKMINAKEQFNNLFIS